jgi:UDP-N-acetylglucosamine acyltransferase
MPDARELAMPRIHPTAIIDPLAQLADDVTIGPYVTIQGPVKLGRGCVVQDMAQLIGPMTLGENNTVGRGAILGDEPQHLSANGDGTDVIIGSDNIFREHVTVHRGSAPGKVTRIGDGNFFMVGSHIGHDCTIGNKVILANNALLGGHCDVQDRAYVSGNSAVHQRMRIGKLAMLSGTSAITRDLPPFVIVQGINIGCGVNVVGMRRAGYERLDIDAVREAYRIMYMQRNLVTVAIEQVERQLGHNKAVAEFVAFVRASTNGVINTASRAERIAA